MRTAEVQALGCENQFLKHSERVALLVELVRTYSDKLLDQIVLSRPAPSYEVFWEIVMPTKYKAQLNHPSHDWNYSFKPALYVILPAIVKASGLELRLSKSPDGIIDGPHSTN